MSDTWGLWQGLLCPHLAENKHVKVSRDSHNMESQRYSKSEVMLTSDPSLPVYSEGTNASYINPRSRIKYVILALRCY